MYIRALRRKESLQEICLDVISESLKSGEEEEMIKIKGLGLPMCLPGLSIYIYLGKLIKLLLRFLTISFFGKLKRKERAFLFLEHFDIFSRYCTISS